MDKDICKTQAGIRFLETTKLRSAVMFLREDRFLNRVDVEVSELTEGWS